MCVCRWCLFRWLETYFSKTMNPESQKRFVVLCCFLLLCYLVYSFLIRSPMLKYRLPVPVALFACLSVCLSVSLPHYVLWPKSAK